MSLEHWNKLKQPPDWALGKITGGKLKGKTDINPIWRIQAMTEEFGVCGVGWKFAVTDISYVDGASGEKLVFVQVDLFINVAGKWSAPIPGCGGDFVADTEKEKLVSNDEAVKMAITDALGNAMKYLGMAATVYSKGIDGTKYSRRTPENPPAQPNTQTDQDNGQNDPKEEEKPAETRLVFKAKIDGEYKLVPLEQVPMIQIEWYAANSNSEEHKKAATDYLEMLKKNEEQDQGKTA